MALISRFPMHRFHRRLCTSFDADIVALSLGISTKIANIRLTDVANFILVLHQGIIFALLQMFIFAVVLLLQMFIFAVVLLLHMFIFAMIFLHRLFFTKLTAGASLFFRGIHPQFQVR